MSDNLSVFQRLNDLASRSYNNNQYTFSTFLSAGEISDYYTLYEGKLSYASPKLYGGTDNAERKIIRFGSEKEFGYVEEFPIVALLIKPLSAKFSDDLNHRDFLGALMNLGIKRELLGDIYIKKGNGGIECCLFCLESIADYIMENLTRIKHTSVSVSKTEETGYLTEPTLEPKMIQVASERADGIVARVYNLSRGDSLELFQKELVFVNSRLCTENAKTLNEGDIVSARGYGKFKIDELLNVSKKGKQNIRVLIYK
ncbi:MAG: YlmH/Sll1252 family protein [Lachnospiraceae bacterium]|nr:YlmH/Sll1252 family protein [Lachnospiraceae bacterium]